MHTLNEMKIEARKDDVLSALRENREKHIKIVAEAREGYMKAAELALEKKLEQIREGEFISITVHLSKPDDHTRTYDTAIKMMEMHTSETIALTATQVRHLIQDDWDWKDRFLGTAAAYSETAGGLLND